MDFKNLNADKNLILSKHFSAGRDGRKIEFVVPHYAAGDLSLDGYYSVWQNREASAHYAVDSNGQCAQLVWDRDTAWSVGNWDANCKSISIEHSNRGDVITDQCRETGAHLVAALCLEFGLGRPEWGKNVRMHREFSATNCPGPLATTYKDSYIKRAQEWYDAMVAGGGAPAPAPQPPTQPSGGGKDITTIAREVMAGAWGNGDDRRRRLEAAGYNYNAVQAKVNELCGVGGGAPAPAPNIDQLARDVIAGKYGTGEARKRALGANYDAVQARVNQMLGAGGSSAPAQNLDAVARAVIRGDYGNGEDRERRLRAAGYDPAAVQARVNQLL